MDSAGALIVLQFAFATLLPVAASVVLTLLGRQKAIAQMGYWPKQVAIGLVFGCIAIFGTEFGIATNDATMNVRDAAPLVAGLYFGGPAGIIAGVIGGVERWFAALWGRGMFTRVACSCATVFAGFYAALLRKYLLDDRRPGWTLAFFVGVVAEVLHMLLVFLTNLDEAVHAFLVVQACTLPMVGCNALSVALAGAALLAMEGKNLSSREDVLDISQKVQRGMLGVVVAGFVATVSLMALLQTSLASSDTQETLAVALQDTEDDIRDASDANLLKLAYEAAQEIPTVDAATTDKISQLVDALDLAEIHVVDQNGIIVASSDSVYLGFDMASGEQSAEFLSLLPGGGAKQVAQDYQPMTMDDTVWRKYAGVSIEGGFLQAGYDATHFVDDLMDQVRVAIANRHVGQAGFLAVLSERDTLESIRSDVNLGSQAVQALAAATHAAAEGEVFDVTLLGVDYLGMYRTTEGVSVVALLPLSEAQIARELSVYVTSFIEVMVFALLFLAIYVLIKRVVVRSIWQVNGRLGQITAGDLNVEVDVRDSSEFALLSHDINDTVAALRGAIAAEAARIERDLATAKAIQASALPRTFPPFPEVDAFDIYASMNAAREVGGDFYDFFLIDDHTLGFLIADVSGKGIPASLFMMAAKSELANHMQAGMDLAEAVHSANWNLCQGNDAGMFVTVWAATLDYDTGLLTYVNAGHNPPLLRHGAGGSWEWLKRKGGLFLGTFETAKYRSATIELEPGDEILLYTDGVNEAFSASEEEYGNDRLEAFLSSHNDLHPRLLVDMLRADVRTWAKGAEQSDDITMLCLEYGQRPEVSTTISVPGTRAGLDELLRRLHFELAQVQCPEEVQHQLDLTVEELFTNICDYGYGEGEEPGKVELGYAYDSEQSSVTMSLTDWGVPFDPLAYDGTGEGDEVTGMGIQLAQANMDDFAYVRDDDANVVAFRKSW